MNLTDFTIFKLRSIIYFTNFPIAYTLAIITCWYKVIPETPNKLGGYLPEEIVQIDEVKQVIRDFVRNLQELI